MKRLLTLLILASCVWQIKAQTEMILPAARKSMLGVYNTSTFSLMPVSKNSNTMLYGDIYYGYYGQPSRMGYSFHNSTGYRFFDKLALGAGVGIDNYESTALSLPLYGEVSGNLLNKRFFPSYYVQGGYGFGVNLTGKNSSERLYSVKGGAMAAVGIGFGGRLDKNTIIRLNFGYRLQKASYTQVYPANYYSPSYTMIRNMTYHRVEVGLSFTFQQ